MAGALALGAWRPAGAGWAPLPGVGARAAAIIFAGIGQRHEAAWTVVNRAESAVAVGDLPRALTLLDEAEARFEQAGDVPTKLAETRCRALLAAGVGPGDPAPAPPLLHPSRPTRTDCITVARYCFYTKS